MVPHALRLSVAALILPALLAGTARAADGPGFSLAAELRALYFNGYCDGLPAAEVDCAKKPTACFLTRSDGTRFAPAPIFQAAYLFQPLNAFYAFGGPAEQSGHPALDEDRWDPLGRLSGLATPLADDDHNVLRLSSEQLAWLLERFMPRPGEVFCGARAEQIYTSLFKPVATTFADAYLFLHGTKAFVGFDRDAFLEGRYAEPAGRYEKLCRRFTGRITDDGKSQVRRMACDFWMRRAYIGQAEVLGQALADALAPFDARLAKRLNAALPKR